MPQIVDIVLYYFTRLTHLVVYASMCTLSKYEFMSLHFIFFPAFL